MGRYYYGDIEGKFWVAIQSSVAADRFGVKWEEGDFDYVSYDFTSEDLPNVQDGLSVIEEMNDLEKIESFFSKRSFYSDEDLEKAGISREEVSEFADYKLGKQIEECLIEKGRCSFEAEL